MSIYRVRSLNPNRVEEIDRLYEICLLTGDNGNDASALYRDPRLLGTLYVGQYAQFSPDFCKVLVDQEDIVHGYAVGTPDSIAFDERLVSTWWPQARLNYPLKKFPAESADADFQDPVLVQQIHSWVGSDPDVSADFPAHFHIDLLPSAQGGGNGRRLLQALFDELRSSGAGAVHLGVGRDNERAIGFYEHLGFRIIRTQSWGFVLGKQL